MMKEARLVLPWNGNMDTDADSLRQRRAFMTLERNIMKAYGGFTQYRGVGAMTGFPFESIVIYDIAMETEDTEPLYAIALAWGDAMKQKTVYMRSPDGNVHLLPLTQHSDLCGKGGFCPKCGTPA